MRLILNLTLLTIILASCQTDKSLKVRFDGIYQSHGDIIGVDNDTARMYVQFYPDGRVIGVTSTGGPFEITSWFNLESENETVSKGTNELHLDLEIKSLINGHIANEKFTFVKSPDQK